MLKVLPIQTKDEQKSICDACNVEYKPDALAYSATVDGKLTGVSQFKLTDKGGMVYDIAPASDTFDFESLFVLGRGTLNFIDLCGVHIARCAKDAGDGRLITAMGFKDIGEEFLFVDMDGMFTGGACTSHKK